MADFKRKDAQRLAVQLVDMIEAMRTEMANQDATIQRQTADIERLRAAGDALAKQITKPCRCVEAHDGAINETCAPCAACFDWEEVRRG